MHLGERMNTMAYSKEQRRSEILKYIELAKTASCAELSERFSVTEETIRKDLQELSEAGSLIRTFGGAAIREYGSERSLEQRIIQNYGVKQKIADAALRFIRRGDLIAMDAGSSISVLAQKIPSDLDVIVLTNSLETTNILAKVSGVSVICTGGKLRQKSQSFQGVLAENAIRAYNLQKAFISCAAVDIKMGVMDTNEEEARIKQHIISQACEIYLLADSSKIGGIAHVTTCDIHKVTTLVTDNGISEEALSQLRLAGIQVVVAE